MTWAVVERVPMREAVLPRVAPSQQVWTTPICVSGAHMLHPRTMPEFLRMASVMQRMECTCGCSIDDWLKEIRDTRDELFVRGADWHLAWWEAEMRMAPRPGDTIYERQDRIISRMRQWRLPTPSVITRVSNSFHLGLVVPIMDYEQHHITYLFVEGRPDNYEDLQGELIRITPARLDISFEFRYLTWGELFEWSLRGGGTGGTHTWQRLTDEQGMTWEEIIFTLPPELPQ